MKTKPLFSWAWECVNLGYGTLEWDHVQFKDANMLHIKSLALFHYMKWAKYTKSAKAGLLPLLMCWKLAAIILTANMHTCIYSHGEIIVNVVDNTDLFSIHYIECIHYDQ